MKILLCSIIRDRVQYIARWHKQVQELIALRPHDEFFLNISESNSQDGSADYLDILKWPNCIVSLDHEVNNDPYIGSIKSEERVKILARRRNYCMLEQNDNYKLVDKIVWTESDMIWDASRVLGLLDLPGDIESGMTLSHRGSIFYDTWGCRRDKGCSEWTMPYPMQRTMVYSAYSGFTVYKGDMIRSGIKFGAYNASGEFDCDSYVICEMAQLAGYHDIYINTNCITLHPPY